MRNDVSTRYYKMKLFLGITVKNKILTVSERDRRRYIGVRPASERRRAAVVCLHRCPLCNLEIYFMSTLQTFYNLYI